MWLTRDHAFTEVLISPSVSECCSCRQLCGELGSALCDLLILVLFLYQYAFFQRYLNYKKSILLFRVNFKYDIFGCMFIRFSVYIFNFLRIRDLEVDIYYIEMPQGLRRWVSGISEYLNNSFTRVFASWSCFWVSLS